MEMKPRSVAFLIFEGVELLDFAGPFEVFSAARVAPNSPERVMDVYTVAESSEPLQCNNPLTVVPKYTMENCPQADLLVIPGGQGTRTAIDRPHVIDWIREQSATAELTTSVCTGSFLLAKAGLLVGKSTTTHWGSIDRMRDDFPGLDVRENVRWVDQGDVVCSAGVSAGIDMAFHILGRLYGEAYASSVARWIEYDHWPMNQSGDE